jgi:hypothetical protein
MRGDNVACLLGALHYIIAIAILVDSIIFIFGIPPLFITRLVTLTYYVSLGYCITAGSILLCRAKITSFLTKDTMETIISRRHLREYRRKKCFAKPIIQVAEEKKIVKELEH